MFDVWALVVSCIAIAFVLFAEISAHKLSIRIGWAENDLTSLKKQQKRTQKEVDELVECLEKIVTQNRNEVSAMLRQRRKRREEGEK